MAQHEAELSPLAPNLLRYQPSKVPLEELAKLDAPPETPEQRRERERMNRVRRSWYEGYERSEWWRQLRQGAIWTWMLMATVFAFGLIIGYFAHGVQRHG